MNIWLINPYGPIQGESWRDYRFTMIAQTLAQHGHHVTWWTANFSHHFKYFRAHDWKEIDVSLNFYIRLVPTSGYQKHISLDRIKFELLFAWRMYRRARQESAPDCIIAVDPPQTTSFVAVKLARYFGARLIIDVIDLWPELFVLAFPRFLCPLAPIVLSPLYALRRYNLRQADAVSAVCATYLEKALKEAPNLQHAITVFCGIDVSAFRAMMNQETQESHKLVQKMGKKPGEVWMIYAGTLGNNYDIDTLLQAALQLEQSRSLIKILLVGDGPLRQHVIDFIKTHQITNLVYLGKLDIEYLTKLYQVCDVGLCTYAPESTVAMPVKVYDYMAAGLPIINSLHGELENLLYEYQIGIQYIAGDPNSLVDAIKRMAANKEQRQIMAINSYNIATQFDKHLQYQKFVSLIEKLSCEN